MVARTQPRSSDAAPHFFQFALPTSLPPGPGPAHASSLGAGRPACADDSWGLGVVTVVFFFHKKKKQTTKKKLLGVSSSRQSGLQFDGASHHG